MKHVVILVCFLSFCMESMANPIIPWLGVMGQQQRKRGDTLRRLQEINERIDEFFHQRDERQRRIVADCPQGVRPNIYFSQVLNQLTTKESEDQELNISCLAHFITQEDKNYLLYLSAYYGKAQSAHTLIESGAQISATRGDLKNTPCHSAVRQGQIVILSLFLNYEPESCDVPNKYGETPFHYALKWEQPKAIALLYKHGIYYSAEDVSHFLQDKTPS